jgi:hypothetical protein
VYERPSQKRYAIPSQAMEHAISVFRDRRTARTSQGRPTLEEQRAGFAPAGRLYPITNDVQVTAVDAGGVPAYWPTSSQGGPRPRAAVRRTILRLALALPADEQGC